MAWGRYRQWRPYVRVAERHARAQRESAKLVKKGTKPAPIRIQGRKIANTFWGTAWCDNLESYSDYENRLPRGRTYARNGSIIHLEVNPGEVKSFVQGQSLYRISIGFKPVAKKAWGAIVDECAGKIGSLLELLEGKLSSGVMDLLARRGGGLFPEPSEISVSCSCPDWATMCKHVAATLYGVGARLDDEPELLFRLRQVDPAELIGRAASGEVLRSDARSAELDKMAEAALSDLFGIELDSAATGHGRRRQRSKGTNAETRRAKPAKESAEKSTTKSSAKTRKGTSGPAPGGRRTKASRAQSASARATADSREKAIVRPGQRMTAQDLIEKGIPRTTFQNWFGLGALARTETRGVYEATGWTRHFIERAVRREAKKEEPTERKTFRRATSSQVRNDAEARKAKRTKKRKPGKKVRH